MTLERQWFGDDLGRLFSDDEPEKIRDLPSTAPRKTLADISGRCRAPGAQGASFGGVSEPLDGRERLRVARPTMRMGVTGHRPNRLHIGEARVASRLREAMVALRDAVRRRDPAAPLVATSPLAEGSDRLFARLAVELGYELHAFLPFASAEYETTFSDASRTNEYRALLRRAASVTELGGSLADAKGAYEAMGRAMVDANGVLMAVWDGLPAAARGGTPEIIAYALARQCPVIWIDARHDREPQRLRSIAPRIDARIFRAAKIADLIA